jgi:hypothetical protein
MRTKTIEFLSQEIQLSLTSIHFNITLKIPNIIHALEVYYAILSYARAVLCRVIHLHIIVRDTNLKLEVFSPSVIRKERVGL